MKKETTRSLGQQEPLGKVGEISQNRGCDDAVKDVLFLEDAYDDDDEDHLKIISDIRHPLNADAAAWEDVPF